MKARNVRCDLCSLWLRPNGLRRHMAARHGVAAPPVVPRRHHVLCPVCRERQVMRDEPRCFRCWFASASPEERAAMEALERRL